jgi:hypothetical protein
MSKRKQKDIDEHISTMRDEELDEFAVALGFPPSSEREWTEEEARLIWLKAGGSPWPPRQAQTSPEPRRQ